MHEEAPALAVLTGLRERLDQSLTHAFASHLHQAKRGHLGDLVLGAIAAQAFDQPAQHAIAVCLEQHVDEVDHNDAANVPEPQLAHDLFGCFEVVERHRLFESATLTHELAGIDVDDRHRLSTVDDE